MDVSRFKTFFLLLICTVCFAHDGSAQRDQEHDEVAMRMIGHQVLLNSGDDSSLVLPIEREGKKYRIRFGSEFDFVPSKFSATIDSIVQSSKLALSYRIEVENLDSHKIDYSFQVGSAEKDVVPCAARMYPKARYSLLMTILKPYPTANVSKEMADGKQSNNALIGSVLVSVVMLVGIGFYFWKRKKSVEISSDKAKIGKYHFDKHNMKLVINNESIDLTSKETDLLALLHESLNETLERDAILKAVWGDEGDYIGRTLDVFISKLRKKFAEDSSVKIVNVRGVGYKMMLASS